MQVLGSACRRNMKNIEDGSKVVLLFMDDIVMAIGVRGGCWPDCCALAHEFEEHTPYSWIKSTYGEMY